MPQLVRTAMEIYEYAGRGMGGVCRKVGNGMQIYIE
jgi:hypothetical protein